MRTISRTVVANRLFTLRQLLLHDKEMTIEDAAMEILKLAQHIAWNSSVNNKQHDTANRTR